MEYLGASLPYVTRWPHVSQHQMPLYKALSRVAREATLSLCYLGSPGFENQIASHSLYQKSQSSLTMATWEMRNHTSSYYSKFFAALWASNVVQTHINQLLYNPSPAACCEQFPENFCFSKWLWSYITDHQNYETCKDFIFGHYPWARCNNVTFSHFSKEIWTTQRTHSSPESQLFWPKSWICWLKSLLKSSFSSSPSILPSNKRRKELKWAFIKIFAPQCSICLQSVRNSLEPSGWQASKQQAWVTNWPQHKMNGSHFEDGCSLVPALLFIRNFQACLYHIAYMRLGAWMTCKPICWWSVFLFHPFPKP